MSAGSTITAPRRPHLGDRLVEDPVGRRRGPVDALADDADPGSPEPLRVEEAPVVRRRLSGRPFRRRVGRVHADQRSEQRGGVGDGPGHGTGGVLGRGDGTIPLRLTRPTVGFSPTSPVAADGHTIDPSVSVPTPTVARLAATAAAVPDEEPHGLRSSAYGLRVCPPRALQPEEELGAADVGPLREVRLPQDHRAGFAEALDQECVAGRVASGQRQRTGGRLHPVAGGDVVLEEDRDPVERTAHSSRARSRSSPSAIESASGFSARIERSGGSSRAIRSR